MVLASHAAAQNGDRPAVEQPQQAQQERTIRLEDLIPQVRLGARVALVAQQLGVIDVLVIVPDAASYGAAVQRWSLGARFPILIDDGTARSREDVARFVRAFQPAKVLRWQAPEEEAAIWRDAATRRDGFDQAMLAAWSPPASAADDQDDANAEGNAEADEARGDLLAQWRKLAFVPPGVVIASAEDPAWTAALALAAGRGQPVAWVDTPAGGPSGEMPLDAADALNNVVAETSNQAKLSWRELGDAIDAVTVCLNCPGRVRVQDDRKYLSLTDVLGRQTDTLDRRARWAWAGQVFGSESEAAYRAMCSLFLQPRRAWLFDGYGEDAPWNLWDMTATEAELKRAAFEVMLDDGARRGRRDWVLRTGGRADDQWPESESGMGVRAGVVAVNTHGQAYEFNLDPGKLRAEGAPFLHVPSAVYFVHSFSAARQGDRNTVAGRWMDRGAFAYCGSVDEPHLQGFMPTPLFARRLVSAVPFGVAGRMDDPHPYARVWKVHVIGDPLFTLHDVPARREAGPEQPGAEDVADTMRTALKERRFPEAMRQLVLLGRDEDAVRLARAIAAAGEDGDGAMAGARLTADVAEPALMSAFREGDLELFVTLGNLLADAGRLDASGKDAAWHALRPALGTLRDDEILLLKRSVRAEQAADDVIDLAGAIRSVQGREAAQNWLGEARDLVKDEAGRKRIDEELAR